MIQIKIPVHSFVDVITNSSTTIYCTATGKSEQFAKDMINEILSLGGSTKTAEDLFDFEIRPDIDGWVNTFEYSIEYMDLDELPESCRTDAFINADWDTQESMLREVALGIFQTKGIKGLSNSFNYDAEAMEMEHELVITAKNSSTEVLNLQNYFNNMFESGECPQ